MGLLIIEMGMPPEHVRSACGSTAEWFLQVLGKEGGVSLRVVRPWQGDALPEPEEVAGAVITGSWAMVTDRLDWSERTADWIRRAMAINLPLFGVCYGHQLMAHALGGRVGDNPNGGEMGALPVTLTPEGKADALTSTLPETFSAYLFHQQSVLSPPPGAVALAASERDACQILRYGENACSTQFHPEFTAAILTRAHEDHASRQAGTVAPMPVEPETPWSRKLLDDFRRKVVGGK
ncbi:MAG: glutamine amidotransferase [Burkholderiaceae bacterium]|jgi:GMP synthase (glutamine-hydrolysing)|nr:glutamine amidotransferase [Burkholderiaceae bacterium]